MFSTQEAIGVVEVLAEYLLWGDGEISREKRVGMGRCLDYAIAGLQPFENIDPDKTTLKLIK